MAGFLILLTIGIPWLGALVVWWVGDRHPKVEHTLAVIFSVVAGAVALGLVSYNNFAEALHQPVGGAFGDFTFIPDGLGVFLAAVATVIGSLAVIFSVNYMSGEIGLGRYYAYVLLFIGAMAGLVLTSNFLLLFAFWEITALCSYALISFHNDDPKAVKGGIKALIMTQVGGIGLLVGSLIIYSHTGSFDIRYFLTNYENVPYVALTVVAYCFLIAAAAKSAQFPFQTWLPDAMEAPTPISALIHAATMVNAGVYLLARFYPAFEYIPYWRTAVIVVGVLSALMAALMALVGTDLKRVLAYSTISQLGFMVYAIGVGGIFSSQFHLLSHSIFKALLFLGAGAVIHTVGTRDMTKMGGLGKTMPFVRTVFVIGGLALSGIPILNGFWSKELILESGLAEGPIGSYIIMLIVSGLTALYTFRCMWMVFYGKPRSELHSHDAPLAMGISLALLAVGTLFSWLLAGPFNRMLSMTLPTHVINLKEGTAILGDVLLEPSTYLALLVIGLGIAAWRWRKSLQGVVKFLGVFGEEAAAGFGFEDLNQGIVKLVQSGAEGLRITQTGLLSWNVLAIAVGLAIVLVFLALGA